MRFPLYQCVFLSELAFRYYNRDDEETPLDIIIALLVLSAKYDFKDLMKDVVMQISKEYPMTLKEMDEVIEGDLLVFVEDQVVGAF